MKQAGFTLVELIAVVVILGILATVAVPQYRKTMERARGAEAYSGLAQIKQAESIYYAANPDANPQYRPSANTPGTPIDAGALAALELTLPQRDWNFHIITVGIGPGATFTATATRKSLACSGTIVTINQTGDINDTPWKNCVNTVAF